MRYSINVFMWTAVYKNQFSIFKLATYAVCKGDTKPIKTLIMISKILKTQSRNFFVKLCYVASAILKHDRNFH